MVHSVTFDDDDDSELHVFSGSDLLLTHYDVMDLDWQEIAERSAIDERRGLVIAQVATLEDLVDEFILYSEDPLDPEAGQRELDRLMLGARLHRLRAALSSLGLLDGRTTSLMDDLDAVVLRRNQLAHGTLMVQPLRVVPISDLATSDLELEWRLVDRRRRTSEGVSMAGLRADLSAAIGAFMALLSYAELFVEQAPHPANFGGGFYLARPTP